MERYGKETKINQELMNTIASYMDDDKRETVHAELAPCEPEEFLKRYLRHESRLETRERAEHGRGNRNH